MWIANIENKFRWPSTSIRGNVDESGDNINKYNVDNCKFHGTALNMVCDSCVHGSSNVNELQFIRILFYFIFTFTITTRTTTNDFHNNNTNNTKNIHVRRKSMLCMRCDHNETISSTKPIFNETI